MPKMSHLIRLHTLPQTTTLTNLGTMTRTGGSHEGFCCVDRRQFGCCPGTIARGARADRTAGGGQSACRQVSGPANHELHPCPVVVESVAISGVDRRAAVAREG